MRTRFSEWHMRNDPSLLYRSSYPRRGPEIVGSVHLSCKNRIIKFDIILIASSADRKTVLNGHRR